MFKTDGHSIAKAILPNETSRPSKSERNHDSLVKLNLARAEAWKHQVISEPQQSSSEPPLMGTVLEHGNIIDEEIREFNCQDDVDQTSDESVLSTVGVSGEKGRPIADNAKVLVFKGTQTDDVGEFYGLQKVLNTKEKLKAFTNIEFDVFDTICGCCKDVAAYNGKTIKELPLKIMLVFIKIRLDIPFNYIAILFNLSTSSASRFFYSTLSLLSVYIKPIIYGPTKEEIMENMPKYFKKYQNTRVVLDCTEIQIDRCKCLKCLILTYSHYKGKQTVKHMIGITPSGLISCVSSGYGGRASDKAIFNHEKLLANDGVMVDKGILIEKECEENLLKLIRPPFLRKQKQFSRADAEETANIARARVHVERAIERIKTFKIMQGPISWYMVCYANEIVIAALVNLSLPILADDKFQHFDTILPML